MKGRIDMDLLMELKKIRYCLAPNTYKTIRGQILCGDMEGAKTGIERIKAKLEKQEGGTQDGKGTVD